MNFNKTFSLLALIIFFTFSLINIAISNPTENAKKLDFREYGPFFGIKKGRQWIRGIHVGTKDDYAQSTWYGTFAKDNMYYKGYFVHTYSDGKVIYQYNHFKIDKQGKVIQDEDKQFLVEDSYVISKDDFEKVKSYIQYDIELPFSFYDFGVKDTNKTIAYKFCASRGASWYWTSISLDKCQDNSEVSVGEFIKIRLTRVVGSEPDNRTVDQRFFEELDKLLVEFKTYDIPAKIIYDSIEKDRLLASISKNTAPEKKQEKKIKLNFETDEKYYALVIGNNDYQHLEKLDAAENDAVVIADVLEKKYGFEVDLLLNADYDQTVNSLFKITDKLKRNDNLFIYYAGHGELDKAENRGYWLPVDASYEMRSKWISNQRIVDRIKATKAKHVLLVADSCFSGTLMRSGSNLEKAESIDAKYIKRLKNKKTRLVITSGGNEPVVDSVGGEHSLFALKFIDTLKNNNTVINSQILFENVRRYVVANADQTPERAMVHKTGHDGGDFLFFPKK